MNPNELKLVIQEKYGAIANQTGIYSITLSGYKN